MILPNIFTNGVTPLSSTYISEYPLVLPLTIINHQLSQCPPSQPSKTSPSTQQRTPRQKPDMTTSSLNSIPTMQLHPNSLPVLQVVST